MAGLVALAGILLAGCGGHTKCVIELKPEGGRLNRKLVVVEHASQNQVTLDIGKTDEAAKAESTPEQKPKEISEAFRSELERIEKLYGSPAVGTNEGKFVFQASFSGELPNDAGGVGSFLHYSNSLGTASLYVERFRGNDDPAGRLQKQALAIDAWVDHVIAWSKQEPQLGSKPGYENFGRFWIRICDRI